MSDEPQRYGPGLHDIPSDVYHGDPAERASLSSTIGRLLVFRSPLHAWTASPRLNPAFEPVEKKTFDVGKAAHRAVLGKGEPAVAYPEDILGKDGAASTKAAKEWAAEQREAGRVPLKRAEVDAIGQMATKVHDRLDQMRTWLDLDRSEITAIGEINGVICRAMIDNAPEDPTQPLWDFKTTTDASPQGMEKAIMNYGYDFQAAHYIDTWKAATGETRNFRFIFQEKEPPFEVGVAEIGYDSLSIGQKKVTRARDLWKQCVASDYWPGYPPGLHRIEMPAFFIERWLDRETMEADFKRQSGRDILDFARRWQAPEAVGN